MISLSRQMVAALAFFVGFAVARLTASSRSSSATMAARDIVAHSWPRSSVDGDTIQVGEKMIMTRLSTTAHKPVCQITAAAQIIGLGSKSVLLSFSRSEFVASGAPFLFGDEKTQNAWRLVPRASGVGLDDCRRAALVRYGS